ncbi:MAG: T9SS type A sorting domain-containing protein, partial [candidate division Zixibacteria bacterium]|nr:T9SS type A sorting domain-containing protein [candidate division Zixibacteria bacterium]
IICADSIDARGDINLNGLPYEIADAVMFTAYFIKGLGAFEYIEGSIAASDVTADGIPLTVGDLVYLIRVIVGDAAPYPKVNPMYAEFTISNGVINTPVETGAAFVVYDGITTPILLADNMELIYGEVDGNTQALVFSTEQGHAFVGDFLAADAPVLKIEMATYDGQPIVSTQVPAGFDLKQNYPNPFNPKTVIAFQTKPGTEWTLNVYNVTGQLVDRFAGIAQGGFEQVEWDASGKASGVYFYRLTAGDFTDMKKMLLLK